MVAPFRSLYRRGFPEGLIPRTTRGTFRYLWVSSSYANESNCLYIILLVHSLPVVLGILPMGLKFVPNAHAMVSICEQDI